MVISTSSTGRPVNPVTAAATCPDWARASLLRRVPSRSGRVPESPGKCVGPVMPALDSSRSGPRDPPGSTRLTAATACGSRSNSSRSASAYPAPPGSPASCLTRTVGACSSLSTTRRTVCVISARSLSSRSGSRPSSRASSAADHVGGHGAQRDHGRGDACGPLGGAEGGDLVGDDARGPRPRRRPSARPRAAAASVSMSTSADAGQAVHRGVDVARHRQVEQAPAAVRRPAGRPRPRRRSSAVSTRPVAPVQETTMSASASAAATASWRPRAPRVPAR